jgi:molecular chaperone DnaK (HSP70)
MFSSFFRSSSPEAPMPQGRSGQAVAYGAWVQAATIEGDTSEAVKDILLLDLALLSLGI